MKRLTRNSYKRKIILFGVFVFMSVALISTGFAAWVMSSNATDNTEGNVNVGVVKDSSLKINFNKTDLEAFKYLFEPAKDDHVGRVRLDEDEPVHEQLSFTISGTITNPGILKENGFTITLSLPAGMQKAIELGYIVAPDCLNNEVVIPVNSETGEFSYTLEFKWGKMFNGKNPSLYYDDETELARDKTGAAREDYTHATDIPESEVKEVLENLRACVFNYYEELVAAGTAELRAGVIAAHEADELPKYQVTLKAIAK